MAEKSGQSEQSQAQPIEEASSEQPALANQPEQPVPVASKKPKVPLAVQEEKLSPKPSLWPIALALTLVITCVGVIVHPILFICGIVLTVLVIIGWILEKH